MRKRVAALIAAFAALALVAANEPVDPTGTATTEMVGLTVEVDHAPVPVDVTALDISTSATTVDDPLAAIEALIADVNGTRFGEFSLRSDGQGDASSSPVAGTILDVSPLHMNTTATDTSAAAIVTVSDDVVAAVQLLGGSLLSLQQLGSVSQVDTNGSVGTVGVNVSSLDLGLGDLLEGILADLPLDVLLALAGDLLDTVEGLNLSALSDAVNAVEDQLAVISDLAESYDTSEVTDSIEALQTYVDGLVELTEAADLDGAVNAITDDENTVDGIVQDAEDLQADLEAGTIDPVTALAILTGLVTDLNDLIADYPDSGAELVTLDEDDLLGTLDDVIEQGTVLSEYLGGLLDTLEQLQVAVTDAVTTLANTLNVITGEVNELKGHLEALLATLGDLTQEAVDELVEALESAGLVGVGDIEVSLSANADADSAEAQLDCVLAGADVDCLAPVETIDQVVVAAVDTVAGVLETLAPGAVEGDVVLRILGEGSSSATEGDTNSAEATLEILRLEIPSVNLDALVPDDVSCSAVLDGVLCDLLDGSLEAIDELHATLTDDVDGIVALVDDAVTDLGVDLGGVDLQAAYDGATDAIVDLDEVLGQLQAALDGVLDLILGSLDLGLRTPSVKLVVDPTATAAFTPGSAGAPTPPTDEPDPASEPEPAPEPSKPSLPATGGGMILLGALAMAGAVALRRRD